MRSKTPLISFLTTFIVVFGVLALAAPLLAASTEKVLYSFSVPDGRFPVGLIFDGAGNLYGTTSLGGAHNYGTVFELTAGANGTWTEKVLYNFCSVSGCTDGSTPDAGLILDGAGNLYGTTQLGGARSGCGSPGCGTVFQLTPGANGTWTEKVLHRFYGYDGINPFDSLIMDAAGNLYGTTNGGGDLSGCHCGVVFELVRGAKGHWKVKVLHRFKGKDGSYPYGGLIFDAVGNLYGTTQGGGGGNGGGTAFELSPGTNGKWTEKVLHNFNRNGKDGDTPTANLILDEAGNLYGTTDFGGSGGGYGGTAFELSPGTNGKWTEKVLYNFCSSTGCADGAAPEAGMIFDAAGNLYGTTDMGGVGSSCCGVVFELSPGANGKWTETVLYNFCSVLGCTDGENPIASLIFDAVGNLYSTTIVGGASGAGAVFEITP